jgi:hypothetical protein
MRTANTNQVRNSINSNYYSLTTRSKVRTSFMMPDHQSYSTLPMKDLNLAWYQQSVLLKI